MRASTAAAGSSAPIRQEEAFREFHTTVKPILEKHCYECHGEGAKKAGLAFDELTTKEHVLENPGLWLKVLKNTRSHVMPPPENPAPTTAEQQSLERWITTGAFALDPNQPDPGRVTIRRLNRTEYRNAIRDLLGVDFAVENALPPDDVGYGFDNIGDVLSISPMRMEKFIEAAMAAVEQGVPMDTVAMSQQMKLPLDFLSDDGALNGDRLSFYRVNKVSHRFHAKVAGEYRIHIAGKVDGQARPDPQRVRVTVRSDGKDFFQQEYKWSDAEYYDDERVVRWEAGDHEVSFHTEPLLDIQPERKMEYRILYVRVDGPLDRKLWEHPPGYKNFYSRDKPPTDVAERRAYAREVLAPFVNRAFRRPVAPEAIGRLVDLAERNYSLPGVPFEKGVAQAMIAVLASPEFLFHFEESQPVPLGQGVAAIDEYTLASRLSFTLWSSIPDEELLRVAGRGELRKNLRAQVQRMLASPKSKAFAENFSGQWLQSRAVLDTQINSADIMALETPPRLAAPVVDATAAAIAAVAVAADAPVIIPSPTAAAPASVPVANAPAADPAAPAGPTVASAAGAPAAAGATPPRPAGAGQRNRAPAIVPGTVLTPEIRLAMKQEAEAYFDHIVRENRSVLELLDSNYTFVNDKLAPVYGLPDITGPEMRKVTLPPDHPRGGVLTMGSVLTVTSNPTRTSPVKRGKWILENILGAPSAPPPPDIPALEDSKDKVENKPSPTQRELLALHRADALCASCHSRMDPLGLALENFNGFGRLRTQELGQPIDSSGELATGEKFSGVRDLKRALVDKHAVEFYRTITEKLLTYTLGRGLEYYDVPAVDRIVEQLEKDEGRFSTLLFGVLDSVPFQQRRVTPHGSTSVVTPASLTVQTTPSR